MASFGEELKREREQKKITLDQVAVSTKISVRMLRALEEEKFDQLPGGIFNKGFVRAYARQLGMDEEKAVADYLAASAPAIAQVQSNDHELRAMAEQKDKERQRQASLKKDFPWGSIAVILLLIALGFSIWGVVSGREGQSGRGKVETSQARAREVQPSLPQPTMTAAPATQVPSKPQLTSESAAKTSDDDFENEVTVRHLSETAPTKPVQTPTKPGNFTLLITAQENSWLSITADGKSIFTGTLIAPGVQLVHAANSIVLRAGNLGGLQLDFNGKRLSSQGSSGEAKTLTFHSEGLVPTDVTPAVNQNPKTVPASPTENHQ